MHFDLPLLTGKTQHDLPETCLHLYLGAFQEPQLLFRLLQGLFLMGPFLMRPTISLHT